MFWSGQKQGRKDALVQIGTRVWIRMKKSGEFRLIGTISNIIRLPGADKPATYELTLDLLSEAEQTVILQRDAGDQKIHQTVLRHEGFDEDVIKKAKDFPHGIY